MPPAEWRELTFRGLPHLTPREFGGATRAWAPAVWGSQTAQRESRAAAARLRALLTGRFLWRISARLHNLRSRRMVRADDACEIDPFRHRSDDVPRRMRLERYQGRAGANFCFRPRSDHL